MENKNNKIEVIHKQDVLGKQFQVYGTFEEPLFLAKDVANWIEHSDVSMMLRSVDEDEKGTNIVCTLGGNQKTWFLTEDGLYEILMLSRKPIAKLFKKQVKTILKTIRTTGAYVSSNINDNQLQSLLTTLEQEMYRRISLEQQLKFYEKAVLKLSEYGIPKAKFGEISKATGLPKDIIVGAYIKSKKTPHISHIDKHLQLLLPLFALEQSSMPLLNS